MSNPRQNPELEAVMKFIDDDIVKSFQESREDTDGTMYTRADYVLSPALTMATLQLARVIREAFAILHKHHDGQNS